MRLTTLLFTVLTGLIAIACGETGLSPRKVDLQYRRITMDAYVDKMKAGWIGQMAGVGWAGATEFRYVERVIPEKEVPAWELQMINQFNQDDLYVEMTFLRTLETHGLDVSIRQAGIDFANSEYELWHANKYGRENLRQGIAPPDSGHPQFSKHSDDIDYQIESDFAGLIAPGMPNVAIELGDKFGHLMNYGDGLYAGQFVSCMYAAAFFETDVEIIIRAGLACIPAESQYHEMVTDVLGWHQENPNDWVKSWEKIETKYQKNLQYRRYACGEPNQAFSIDAKINGAYIVMGLLYGAGDLDKTIVISMRCGQDSDCNPSSAAGVLFTSLGFANVPEKFALALDLKSTFSHTPYTFGKLIDVSKALARDAVIRSGGRIEITAAGQEVLVIPVQKPVPSGFEKSWEPEPIKKSRFSSEEMARIRVSAMEKGS